jgi:hypothetical protein
VRLPGLFLYLATRGINHASLVAIDGTMSDSLEQFFREQLERIKQIYKPVTHAPGPKKPDMNAQEGGRRGH